MRLNISYIFHGLGLLAILFASLLGLSYIAKGNEIVSVGGALGIALLLSTFVHLMIKGKNREQNKGITFLEWTAYALYIAVAVGSFFIVRHFVNVDYLLKDTIIKDSILKLEQNETMFTKYKEQVNTTIEIIDTELRNAVIKGGSHRRDTFAANGIDPSRISNYTTERENIKAANERRALQDIVSLEQDFLIFKQQKEQVLNNWKRFRLHRTLLEIDNKYDNTLATLQVKFKAPEKNKAWNRFSFEYLTSPRQDNLIENPDALIERYQPSILYPLLGILLAHFFVLMPYLFMERFGTKLFYRKELKDKVIGIE